MNIEIKTITEKLVEIYKFFGYYIVEVMKDD